MAHVVRRGVHSRPIGRGGTIRINFRALLVGVTVAGCAAAVAAVMVSTFAAASIDLGSSLVGIVAFVFLVAVVGLLTVSFRQRVGWSALGRPRAAPSYDQQAVDDSMPVSDRDPLRKQRMTFGSIDFLLNALLDPPSVFGRVSESVELFSRSIKVTSRFTVDLESNVPGADSPRVFLVPIHLAKKPDNRDLLLDGLRVEGPEGRKANDGPRSTRAISTRSLPH